MSMRFLSFLAIAAILGLLSCTKDGSNSESAFGSNTVGTGGSLARFTIAGNALYVVDDYTLKTFDISNPALAQLRNTVTLRFGVETIYPFKDKLFIGSRDGMYIYSISSPFTPVELGQARHTRSCDPVVANDSIAFVTLRGNQACGPARDGLYVYDIRQVTEPQLICERFMDTPSGIGLSNNYLFVCRQSNGLDVYSVTNPANPVLVEQLSQYNFEDVICYDDLLICYISTGVAFYNISNPANPVELSVLSY
jgi:hypothetical protein